MSDSDLSVLRAYLGERDAPCPACGYNLRGVQDPVCPECGGPVELSIGRPQRGYLLVLLLIFGYLALAAGIDIARGARAAVEQARVSQILNLSFGGSARISMGASISAQSIIINGNTVRPGRPVTIGGMSAAATGTGRTFRWSQVAWQTWLGLGWSGALAAGALAGVAAVLIRRPGLIRAGPGRTMLGAAVALVALHLSVQAFLLVRELMA